MAWDPQSARQRSFRIVESIGFPRPPDWFPVIERGRLRPPPEVRDRALVLNVVINCSFGMPTDAARSWLSSNGLADALSPGEEDYLVAVDDGVQPDACGHQLQIEAMWTLAWALSLAQEIDWGAYCADALASWLPDLRSNEGSTRFRTATALRAEARVLDELDTAFCLSWGCAESNLRRLPEPGGLPQYVVWERRRALEWLVGDDWDDPDMST